MALELGGKSATPNDSQIAHLKKLKRDIERRIYQEVNEFEKETGLEVQALNLYRKQIDAVNSNSYASVLLRVDARIEI